MGTYSSIQYLLDDYPRTLFPLTTTQVIIHQSGKEVIDYIYQKILDKNEPHHSFLSQTRCNASKIGFHLRRTVKLDPIGEMFIYDIIYRNRNLFRKDHLPNRRSFGYRFEQGVPISPARSYGDFRSAVLTAKSRYKYAIKFDIASYFNSLYHHYIVRWFDSLEAPREDVEAIGRFLREANSGISIDCLPHGIHPCKVVGAEFLKFIDTSAHIRCELLLRFMDDFYLFSNNESTLINDFIIIQQRLGEKGLSLNTAKTIIGEVADLDVPKEVDTIKASLLRVRRKVIEISGEEIESGIEHYYEDLTQEQVEYLLNLLKDPEIDESDAELVLALLRDHGQAVLEQLESFLIRFPSLSKRIFHFARYVLDKEALAVIILQVLKTGKTITEDHLFWMAKLAEEYLSKTTAFPELLIQMLDHPSATTISKAKILEIPEPRFGMTELREEHLRTGKSDWLAWAAAAGSRKVPTMERNHVLSYFAKASSMNRIVAECIRSLP